MKRVMLAIAAAVAVLAHADEVRTNELETVSSQILWGFTSWGLMSGYQLFGNLVNCEPTIQSYSEINVNLPFEIGCLDDLGHVGVAAFMNSDLTGQRSAMYRRAFNEMDPMVHWKKTFFFDEEKTWGLDYCSRFVWWIYPDSSTDTTWNWDHTFAIVNPYVTPYLTWVREYSNGANLMEFGLKRPTQITKEFSINPSANFVWREAQYVWCFPTAGFTEFAGSGMATMRLQVDARYQITGWLSVWAKVAYCRTIDPELRDIQDDCSGADYAKYGDFAWGGVGMCLGF